MLSLAFSFSQCLLPAIDPNRVRSCCVFSAALLLEHLSSILSLWSYLLPKRPAFYGHFSPLGLTLSIILRCFFGHVTVCKNQKLQHVGLYFNAEQHHLFRSTLRPGVAFPVQVTRKKYDLMKEEAFLKPSLKCRRVFMSAAAIVNITEPHGNIIMVPKSAPLGVWMRV